VADSALSHLGCGFVTAAVKSVRLSELRFLLEEEELFGVIDNTELLFRG
jgi:hypothetical protein